MTHNGQQTTAVPAAKGTKLRRLAQGVGWCGVPLGPPSSADLLSQGASTLVPALFAGLTFAAAAVWMIRRWGVRPPSLPPGAEPPVVESPAPEATSAPTRPAQRPRPRGALGGLGPA